MDSARAAPRAITGRQAAVAGAATAAAALALAGMLSGQFREPVEVAIAEVLVGWSFIAAGMVAAARRPGSRAGLLMIAVGFPWLLREIQYIETSLTYTLGMLIEGVHWLVLAHLITTYPTGRVQGRLERITVTAIYVYLVPNMVGTLPFDPPRDCPDCPANLISVHPDAELAEATRLALTVVASLLPPLGIACFLRRWRHATPSGRRAFTPVFAGAVTVAAVAAAGLVSVGPLENLPKWLTQLTFMSLSAGLLIGLLRSWLDRQAMGRLVLELGQAATPDRVRELLAEALHDPTLELVFWDADARGYLDASGRPTGLPASGERAMTRLGPPERPLIALLHDPLLLDDPVLVHAVGEAARFALDNDRLQAEVRAQLEELRASRQRIAEAALSERRRVERDLHDGAQQRLITLSLGLAMAEERAQSDPELAQILSDIRGEAGAALTELRELARGIHPPLLSEAGLGPALSSLAERAAIPTVLLEAPDGRLPAAAEATAYFVVSESLANVAKHARASRATVRATVTDGDLVVEVADDGIGGAAMDGSGLAGLADRVSALGGRLDLDSPAGGGTRVTARIPCG